MKKVKLFKTASIIFIISLIGIFSFRLIYYYRLLNVVDDNTNTNISLSLFLKAKNNLYKNNNLKEYNKRSYVLGKEKNNYVNYSGRYWRIMSVNPDNTLTLVSNEVEVLFPYSTDNYPKSSLNKYLNDKNGYYYKTLLSPDSYLNTQEICIDKIKDIEDINCKKTTKVVVGTISLTDYVRLGRDSSFIHDYANLWTSNSYDGENMMYVTEYGNISHNTNSHHYGVKTTIVINSSVVYTKGDGSYANPYYIGDETGSKLLNKEVGKYISYSNLTWRIVEQTEDGTKAVLDGYIDDDKMMFDQNSNEYTEKTSLYKYLNKNFYKTLKNNRYLVEGKFYNGVYYEDYEYNYENIKKSEMKAKIGLLNITDLFVLDYQDTITMTRGVELTNNIYSIVSYYNLIATKITKEYKIRPAIYLNKDLDILSGDGSNKDPFVVGESGDNNA